MSPSTATADAQHHRHPLWLKIVVGLVVLVALLALVLAFFPWDVLRGPLNRYVSEHTGRHFEITRKLDVKLGRTTRILADGVEFANPDWAHDPMLVKADSAEVDIRLFPLLHRRIELPLIVLHKPQLGLQLEADGRRTWALGRDTADPRNRPVFGALVVDQGTAHFIAKHHGADIQTEFAIEGPVPVVDRRKPGAEEHMQLPLSFEARGTWQTDPFTAQGRTGNVLYLSAPLQRPFPLELTAAAGPTSLKAQGALASLVTFDGADLNFDLRGPDLAQLYKLFGVVLPATPRYALRGHLSKKDEVWTVRDIGGKLGNTDLAGELSYDRSHDVPMLTGSVKSNSLDFDDLAPLVGLPEQPRSAAALPELGAVARAVRVSADPTRKVLPTKGMDLARLKAMNADVSYSAARIVHPRALPLERMSLQAKLKDGRLLLESMKLGVAGGTLTGSIHIDGNSDPALAETHLDARALELNKLFPGVKITQASFGKIHGDIDLKGRGNSVAQMLGTSSGNVAMLMGSGQISNLLLEIAGLDGAEIIKFMLGGDRNVALRCGAAAFDVKNGQMTSRALVLDTDDTVFYGDGGISLARETMDLTLRPYPKDMSILALRSPLKLAGSFVAPKAGVDKAALTQRAGIALALGAINPLLALASTVETGPGKNADCGAILREAASPSSKAKMEAMAQAQKDGKTTAEMGAPGGEAAKSKPSFLSRMFGKKSPGAAGGADGVARAAVRPLEPGAPN